MRNTLSFPGVAWALLCSAGSIDAQSSTATSTGAAQPMERVTGIGGFFFRASDPKALAEWYERHLGVTRTPESYSQQPWEQAAGPTIFGPFQKDTKYFGSDAQQWMINFRVRDLDAMVAQLRRASIEVEVDSQVYPNGRFARPSDPEGNPIQLWEPKLPG
jgi:predicted enzyme related to lactoylglutathione lyase